MTIYEMTSLPPAICILDPASPHYLIYLLVMGICTARIVYQKAKAMEIF